MQGVADRVIGKTKGRQMEEASPSMIPSHMYQMWGSGGLYEPLWE